MTLLLNAPPVQAVRTESMALVQHSPIVMTGGPGSSGPNGPLSVVLLCGVFAVVASFTVLQHWAGWH